MNASRIFGDYHRMLAPRESYEGKSYVNCLRREFMNIIYRRQVIIYISMQDEVQKRDDKLNMLN